MPFLSTEHRFILELLRRFLGKVDKISPFPGMDWEKIHTIITNHGLYPIAHYILKQDTIAPPKPFERQWAAMRADILALNLALLSELREIASRYPFNDLAVVQGGALLDTLYMDLSLRPLCDMDLLVNQKHKKELAQAFAERGFTQNKIYPGHYEKGSLVFDVHFDLLETDRISARWFISPDLTDTTVLHPHASIPNLFVLSPERSFIHCSLHTVKHSYSRWIWGVDLALFLDRNPNPLFLKQVLEEAKRLGVGRPLAHSLMVLRDLFGFPLSKGAFGYPPNRIEQRIIDRIVNAQPMEQAGDLLFFFTIPGIVRKMRFAFETIFPRPSIIRQTANHESESMVKLYLKRIGMLASFCVRMLRRGSAKNRS
ncbi:MAG: hypothetical protein A2350_01165 [Candidatus Raymondbacteria bacterium RifOxyB12_full_50_8]|uniref:Nucleotidyltransferase n=1 Tax=Candidatus Raymondbacteria bacterium RIFOXYD12_FULL_49_13 TaxID=1817890 RepID=A0A1F7F1P2_UNCRA|nr:MAG: hypothetical protein A2248_07550 [Candidatus Raymondbacteria bacterium RIFOXYA2_FULL_49_16]OGJ88759.1 MAG: hypothetical protein A2350_01165 [Candidatus Raymondbacteria bacterium RifOxyB12_full_50_8]OGJ96122.1 MAG: hypothetical protein A2453_09405 [Candidatus Raymondbacteria bacterium RIFOXYC2_FULL_50_21]OGK00585.1 MAG: hypothetical protein A2519_21615 [Candidatus Raymondbacteria bacterium RIFOXYD12_FULL_49_13]OGP41129.1 MAG: hypothetical protein A2324_09800 [Candidatus Raymondbacteria b